MSQDLHEKAGKLVLLESWLIDQRDWDSWLALYATDAQYWLPCWKDEYTLTSDPQTEMSLIYYPNRSGLEDRVFRLRTERSLASTPLPRTAHLTSIVHTSDLPNGSVRVESNWVVHTFRLDQTHSFFGHQTHVIQQSGEELKFASRKIVLCNDIIPNVLDIYSV